MAETTVIAPGKPSWVDLASPDFEASKRFYTSLFGWRADTIPDPQAGGYTMFSLNGKHVAGGGPPMDPRQPAAWTTYIAVTNADAVAARVTEAGGKVLMAPMDVMQAGRMAVFQDPTGAAIAVWQAGQHRGADVIDEPGAMCWHELATRDTGAAITFYERVFGWEHHTHGEGSQQYTEFKLDGHSIAGMRQLPADVPAAVPAHWLVYFAVDDCEAAVARTRELGGDIMVPPMTIPQGTFAILTDSQSATFAVIANKG